MGVVVHRRELEQRAELGRGLLPAADAEVRDPQSLTYGGLVRLAALRLLERARRLRGHPGSKVLSAALIEAVRRFGQGGVLPREADSSTSHEARTRDRNERRPRSRSRR